jgi:hypothetical protein
MRRVADEDIAGDRARGADPNLSGFSPERRYGSIGPALYGLRTAVVTLVLLALLRSRRLRWEFRDHRAVLDDREVVYSLADRGIRQLGGKRLEPRAYLRDEYALDALVDYRLDAADPLRDVPQSGLERQARRQAASGAQREHQALGAPRPRSARQLRS